MKTRYIILTLFLICGSSSFAQNKLFDKYAEMDSVTSIYISKAMFQMMPNMEANGLNLMNMKGKIDGLQIISTKQTDLKEQMSKEFGTLIGSQYEELIRIKNDRALTTFYIKKNGNLVNELIMLSDKDNKYSVIQLLGNFTLQDIQDISKNINK